MGRARAATKSGSSLTGEQLLALLAGETCSPELRRALWACQRLATGEDAGGLTTPRFSLPSSWRTATGALLLPGLAPPVRGTLAAFADSALPVWALLVAGEARSEKLLPALQDLVLAVWGGLGGEEASDPGCRALSIPLLWLGPCSGEDTPVRMEGELTWKKARDRGTSWFVDHLRRAQGRDELAAWVLRRMPPVWRLPNPELLEAVPLPLGLPWRAASEEERKGTPRRPRAPRPSGGPRP